MKISLVSSVATVMLVTSFAANANINAALHSACNEAAQSAEKAKVTVTKRKANYDARLNSVFALNSCNGAVLLQQRDNSNKASQASSSYLRLTESN